MKKILIIYPSMMVGGSTTSLLSILNMIDYDKYHVDLLMLRSQGKLFDIIPKQVNVLPFAMIAENNTKFKLRKAISPVSLYHLMKAKRVEKKFQSVNMRSQIMQMDTLHFCRQVEDEYDVAISFLEGWPLYMLAKKIKAKKKIAWIHLNYQEAKMNSNYDLKYLQQIDRIVLVSESCKISFDQAFPSLKSKSCVIENILSQKFIKERSCENLDDICIELSGSNITLITVCRIVFYHKGLDRAVHALFRLKSEGFNLLKLRWYIIGDGPDFQKLRGMIDDFGLTEVIVLCGEHINPLPIEKKFDIFFLPSRYEGKPMAVTEAQMLGLIPVVTNYSSANEQIQSGIDGLIIPNSDEDVYYLLRDLLSGEIDISDLRKKVLETDYSNTEEFKKVVDLIEG